KIEGSCISAGRGSGVAGGDEDPVDARLGESIDDLGQLGSTVDHPGGEVWHRTEAEGLQLLGRGQGGREAQSRRGGDRASAAGGAVCLVAIVDPRRRQHLVAGGAQKREQSGL